MECVCKFYLGSCINRIPLLTGLYNLVQNNNRINASTSVQNYPPWNVRMTSNGWCSASTCVAATAAMEQYLLINFGAEVVVEAIGTAAASNGNYVENYMVEYARSDGQYFAASSKVGTVCGYTDAEYPCMPCKVFLNKIPVRYRSS